MAFSDVTPHSRYLIIKIAEIQFQINATGTCVLLRKKKIAKIAKNIAFFSFLLI